MEHVGGGERWRVEHPRAGEVCERGAAESRGGAAAGERGGGGGRAGGGVRVEDAVGEDGPRAGNGEVRGAEKSGERADAVVA